ncbi:hypothetical protein FALBO_1935 [Fusarium albosuccineum]|uniref:Uncharacterized protein n=1 Tax=Fusarium albosuccineum TaxID=1237068 RepID=A0A8H4LLW8_9HYPO|nr:hypothetical protein FALBO_1935 [Fusarium albosuccineum]
MTFTTAKTSPFSSLGQPTATLKPIFRVYDDLLIDADAHLLQVGHSESTEPGPITHRDVKTAARLIRESPEKTFHQMTLNLQERLPDVSAQKASLTIRVAVRTMFMLDSAVSDWHGPSFTIGRYRHVSWELADSFYQFILKCFHKSSHESEDVMDAMANKRSLKAWKLKARLGITFRATDNIAQHLLLDADNRILYLFHHTSFLKAQLSRLQGQNIDTEHDILNCLAMGILPPRLLAETLHSLQSILFHWNDERSSRILRQLIQKKGFDKDCSEPEGYKILDDTLDNFEYLYWGHRLAEIYDLVMDRPPKNWFERWIKWQSSESNAFAVALAALIISIIVGCLSLGIGALQAWIAWRQWKDSP